LYGPYLGKPKNECSEEEIKAYESGSLKNDDKNNIWNGLVRIPQEICKEANLIVYDVKKAEELHLKMRSRVRAASAKAEEEGEEEPMDTKEDEESEDVITEEERQQSIFLNPNDDEKVRCWYAVDLDHILAWGLKTSADQRKSAKINAERFDVTIEKGTPKEKRIPYCYLVPDTDIRKLIRGYNKRWNDRVDVRDASGDVGFVIAPRLRNQGNLRNVQLTFRVHAYVIIWDPLPSNKTHILPKLHPLMPTLQNFVNSPFDLIKQQQDTLK